MEKHCSGGKSVLGLIGYGIEPGEGIKKFSQHKAQGIKECGIASTYF